MPSETSLPGTPASPEVMVVDDHPPNVLLLEQMLAHKGYKVRSYLGGRAAFDSACQAPPDLVLLDINMPELNGYETCKLFKQEPALAAIPIVFLSAISQTENKTEAFRCGGVDYISKPFEIAEVYARVETHLKVSALQKCLREQNARLEAAVEERTRELARAHAQLARLDRAKSDFLYMISHELRTPLNGLLGAAELILSEMESISHAEDLAEMLCESRQRILSLVDSSLLLTQIEIDGGKFQSEEMRLADVLAESIRRAGHVARSRSAHVDLPPGEAARTMGNRELLVRAWQALLETALRFAAPGDTVVLTLEPDGDTIRVAVEVPSGEIPEAVLADFFRPFGISEASTTAGHLGLDPAMASRILSLWGSTVEVSGLHPAGVRFTVHSPAAGREHGSLQTASATGD